MGGWLNKTYELVFNYSYSLTKLACGKIHEYPFMTLYFYNVGEVVVTMIPNVTEIMALFLP